jgi:integrase
MNVVRWPADCHVPLRARPGMRSVATIRQVFAISQLIERRYAARVLLAAFTGLRWGELVALRRSDLDLEWGTVTVSRRFAELKDGRRVTGPPKSTAGVRVVALPAMIVDVMKAATWSSSRLNAMNWSFRGPLGASLRRNNFHRSVHWSKIVVKAGLPAGFHFHDLRHTDNNLAAASGASTRELMYRMGHGSMRRPDLPAREESAGPRDRRCTPEADRAGTNPMWPVRGPRSSSGPSRKQISGPQEGSH